MTDSNPNDVERPVTPSSSPGNARRTAGRNGAPTGPVADLESHLSPEWWQTLFDELYLQTDGDVVEDAEITEREVDAFLEVLSLEEEDRILDLCCGQGRHGIELARRGFSRVEGLDYSADLIEIARDRAEKAGLEVDFQTGDARSLPFEANVFDAILLVGNSFGYFADEDDDRRVLEEARRVLKPTGHLLLDVSDGQYQRTHFEKRSWEWIGERRMACRERTLSEDEDRLITREVIADLYAGLVDDRFYAERLYTSEDLTALLEGAGFGTVTFTGRLGGDSTRNQDLGMMARRHLIRAGLEQGPEPQRRFPSSMRDVLVLLGDPRLPEAIEPTDDLRAGDEETVRRLKKALGSISGYQFSYLDDHETLLQDLRSRAGELDYVLNFCDDGFRNDARQELHIPAVLELDQIPYSGANPQCLATCYDKSLVRGAAREMGIPVANAVLISGPEEVPELPFSFPALVKANSGDGSLGLTKENVVRDRPALRAAIERIQDLYPEPARVLVEEYLPGEELTVGIIGNPPSGHRVLPIVREDYSGLPADLPQICGYEAKWMPDSPYGSLRSVPADLSPEIEQKLRTQSLDLFDRLECRDYARIDWRLDEDGQPRLLEVNPNPGWCWDGHLAKQSELIGWSYAEMLAQILQVVDRRLGLEKRANAEGEERPVKIRSRG